MTYEDHVLGNAGYAVTGSGGGGEGGKYVFASLEELDSIIADWTEIYAAIRSDGESLSQAQYSVVTPAEDAMSMRQSSALGDSVRTAIKHNKSLSTYAHSYIVKLRAARDQYVQADNSAAAHIGHVDEV